MLISLVFKHEMSGIVVYIVLLDRFRINAF